MLFARARGACVRMLLVELIRHIHFLFFTERYCACMLCKILTSNLGLTVCFLLFMDRIYKEGS